MTTARADAPASAQTIHSLETTTSAWVETPLGVGLAATGRPCVLLCGYWLDECITFTALRALGEGYDVYLVTDASPSLDKDARDTALLRLVQAGIVPTTTRQTIREWAAEVSERAGVAAAPRPGTSIAFVDPALSARVASLVWLPSIAGPDIAASADRPNHSAAVDLRVEQLPEAASIHVDATGQQHVVIKSLRHRVTIRVSGAPAAVAPVHLTFKLAGLSALFAAQDTVSAIEDLLTPAVPSAARGPAWTVTRARAA